MTVSPWTDTAKMLSSAIFGDPRMRAESEKMDLERKKADIAERQYLLEEALNPVKIRQAEAEAARNAAQTGVYNIERDKGSLELDALRRFGDGSASQPDFTQELSGQSNGGIPPISMDAFDAPVPRVDIQKPGTPEDFASMLSGGSPSVSPDRSFADVLSDAMSTKPDMPGQQPSSPRKDYFGEARLLVQSGRLDPDKMGSYILSREAMDQAGGSASPQDRLRLLSTGAGNPFSQDETLTQALGGQRSQEQLANMAEDRGLTSDIQNFRYAQGNPDFAAMLAEKNDGQSLSVTNPDGTVVTYGKPGKEKPPGYEQARAAGYARRAKFANERYLEKTAKDPEAMINIGAEMLQRLPAFGDVTSNIARTPEQQVLFHLASEFIRAKLRKESGAAITAEEWRTEFPLYYPVTGDSKEMIEEKALSREMAIEAMIGESGNAYKQLFGDLDKSKTNQAPPGVSGVQNADPRISSDEEFDALPSGTFFYGPDGQKRRKP